MVRVKKFYCMVPSCKKKQPECPSKQFLLLPNKGRLRDAWLEAVKFPELERSQISPVSKHFRVCPDHFKESDFERDLRSELLGLKKPKRLKSGVVPSLKLDSPVAASEEVEEEEEECEPMKVEVKEEQFTQPEVGSKSPEQVIVEDAEPELHYGCLICSNIIEENYSRKFNHPGANNYYFLNKQLWNVFVLNKVLKWPSFKCQKLLQKYGELGNPGDWFNLCSKCSLDIGQAMQYHQEILGLQNRLDTLLNRLNKTAQETVELNKDSSLKKTEVEIELWSTIRGINEIATCNASVKEEPVEEQFEYEEPIDIDAPVLPVVTQSHHEVLATVSRIDRLLEQNEAILAESVVRPGNFTNVDSDSNFSYSDSDEAFIKPKKKVRKTSKRKATPVARKKSVLLLKTAKLVWNRRLPKFPKIPCLLCPAIFYTLDLLNQHNLDHEASIQNDNSMKTCEFCGLLVKNELLLEHHLKSRHEDSEKTKPFPSTKDNPNFVECPFCPMKFHRLQQYESHVILHERNVKDYPELNCTTCHYAAKNEKCLKLHHKNAHKAEADLGTNVCEACGFTISKTRPKTWESHQLRHKLEETRSTETGDFGCPLCQENFRTMKYLIIHKRKEHASDLGFNQFLCVKCPRTFLTKRGLDDHVESAHSKGADDEVHPCEICKEVFFTKQLLSTHMKDKHNPLLYICEHCGGEYKSMSYLIEHKRLFYGEGLEETEDGKPVANFYTERFKRRLVQGSRNPQQCRYCSLTLPHMSAWKRHVRTHANIKCDHCDKLFINQDTMRRHKIMEHRSNSSTKTNCQHCGKEFKHKVALYSHYSNCKPYCEKKRKSSIKCDKCKKSFMNMRAFGGHVACCKKRHGNDGGEENKHE